MTYFYAQLFAMDTEIRATFPAAMDVQRRRFFEALRVLRERGAPDRLIHYDLDPKASQGL
jgi:hypothetical protein